MDRKRQDRYLFRLVKECLGGDSAKVFEAVLSAGSVRLSGVTGKLKMSDGRIRQALLGLVHHNVVKAEESGRDILYSVIEQNVFSLCSVRRSQQSLVIQEKFGAEAEQLLHVFFQQGRVSREQALKLIDEESASVFDEMVKHGFLKNIDEQYFMISPSAFSREYLKNFVCDYVSSRHGSTAYHVVRSLLDSRIEVFSAAELDRISKNHSEFDRKSMRVILKEMSSATLPVITYKSSQESGELCQINYEGIVREAKIRKVQSILINRFGKYHARVFRLLSEEHHLQVKQISDKALVAEKKCREILSALSKEHLVVVQEVPKTSDREPRNTIYLYHVDVDRVFAGVLGTFYFAFVNLRERIDQEEDLRRQLLQKISRFEEISKEHFSELEMKEHAEFLKISNTLEQSCHNLNQSITLFRDF